MNEIIPEGERSIGPLTSQEVESRVQEFKQFEGDGKNLMLSEENLTRSQKSREQSEGAFVKLKEAQTPENYERYSFEAIIDQAFGSAVDTQRGTKGQFKNIVIFNRNPNRSVSHDPDLEQVLGSNTALKAASLLGEKLVLGDRPVKEEKDGRVLRSQTWNSIIPGVQFTYTFDRKEQPLTCFYHQAFTGK